MNPDSLFATRFARFILVGLSNTLISFLVFHLGMLLLKGFHFRAAGSQVVGYSAGVIWSYYWNRRWSFQSKRNVQAEFPRFLTVQLLCLVLSAAAVGLACDYAQLPATLTWVVVMAGITVLNFSLLQWWVFRSGTIDREEGSPRAFDRFLVALASLVTALSFGVSFGDGGSNHPVYLISGMRLLSPDFLANDWWAAQTSHYHHAFAYLTAGLSALNILPWSMALGNIASLLFVLGLLYHVLSTMDRLHASYIWLIIAVLFFCIDGTRSVALTYFFSPSLQPSTISSVFFFTAMVFYIKRSFLISGCFLAMSSLFHSNFLLLGFPFFGLAHLTLGRSELLKRLLSQFAFSTLAVAFQIPAILHVSGWDLPQEVKNQANHILINIAAPYHYKPITYVAGFSGLSGWCLIALSQVRVLRNDYGRRMKSLFFSSLLLILMATLVTTFVFMDSVSRLFVWRLAPFCLLLAYIMVALSMVRVFASDITDPSFPGPWSMAGAFPGFLLVVLSLFYNHLLFTGSGHLATPSAGMILLGFCTAGFWWLAKWKGMGPRLPRRVLNGERTKILLFLALCVAVVDDFSFRRYNLLHSANASESELFEWAAQTDPNTLFMIPPNLTGFRLFGKRAVVAEGKAVPFRPDEVLEWYERMKTLCGEDHGSSLQDMERGYLSMDLERLKKAVARYGVDYVVTYRWMDIAENAGLEVAFENELFKVLRAPAGR
jgi:putative flippase GtrA